MSRLPSHTRALALRRHSPSALPQQESSRVAYRPLLPEGSGDGLVGTYRHFFCFSGAQSTGSAWPNQPPDLSWQADFKDWCGSDLYSVNGVALPRCCRQSWALTFSLSCPVFLEKGCYCNHVVRVGIGKSLQRGCVRISGLGSLTAEVLLSCLCVLNPFSPESLFPSPFTSDGQASPDLLSMLMSSWHQPCALR